MRDYPLFQLKAAVSSVIGGAGVRVPLLVDADVLRGAGPASSSDRARIDADTTAHRAQLLLDLSGVAGATSPVADGAGLTTRPVLADVLLSDDGAIIGLRLTPIDDGRAVVIEQRFDDADVVIAFPDVDS